MPISNNELRCNRPQMFEWTCVTFLHNTKNTLKITSTGVPLTKQNYAASQQCSYMKTPKILILISNTVPYGGISRKMWKQEKLVTNLSSGLLPFKKIIQFNRSAFIFYIFSSMFSVQDLRAFKSSKKIQFKTWLKKQFFHKNLLEKWSIS